MHVGFVLLNCDLGAEEYILDELNQVSQIKNAYVTFGAYDVIAEIHAESQEEFEKEVNLSKTWERKTKPFGAKSSVNRTHSDGNSRLRFGIEDPFSFIDSLGNRENNLLGAKKRLNHSEQKALSILGATDAMTKDEIRKLYKILIKDLHPDTNDGKRDDEERMTEVVWAWDQIRNSKRFDD